MPPGRSSHLFLSYARDDADLVRRLGEAIRARGWQVWVDRTSIPSASEWMAEIRRGIESADGFVFVLTPSSVASRMCRVELAIAVDLSKRLLPLWVLTTPAWNEAQQKLQEQGGPDLLTEVPPELAKLDYIDINDFVHRADPLQALVDELLQASSRDLSWLRQHTQLQGDVKRWLDSRYADAALLRSELLAAAEEMLSAEGKDPPLTELQREYIERSSEARRSQLEREARQLARRILDLPPERVAVGVMLGLEGLTAYLATPELHGALRTLLSRWPLITVFSYESFVTSAAFGGNGTCVLTTSTDGWLTWIDPQSDDTVRRMGRDGVGMTKAVLMPDGKRAATACTDGYVRIVDLTTGGSNDIRVGDVGVDDLAVDADGRAVIATSGAASWWIDLAGGRQLELPLHPATITSVTFLGPSEVVTTCEDGQVRVLHLGDEQWDDLGWSEGAVNRVRLSPDGASMVMTGAFPGAVILDARTRDIKHRLEIPGGSALLSAFSADGGRIALTDIWGSVFVFASTGELVNRQNLFERYAWDVAMNRDGSIVAAASDDGRAVVYDVASGRQWLCAGHDGPVHQVAFDATGSVLLTRGSDTTVRLFETATVPGRVTFAQQATIVHTDLAPNGTLVATTGRDGTVRTYDIARRAMVARHTRPGEDPVSSTFASDDVLVVAYERGLIVLVDARSGAELRSLETPPIDAHAEVRLSRDQRHLVVWYFDEIVRILSPETGTVLDVDEAEREQLSVEIRTQLGLLNPSGRITAEDSGGPPHIEREGVTTYLRSQEHQLVRAGFAPDGSVVVGAALNRDELPIFDSADGELVATLDLSHPSNDARFSADGSQLIATWLNAVSIVRYPSTARLLDLAAARLTRPLTPSERAEFGLPAASEERQHITS